MVPILMYHQVSATAPPSYRRYTVTPADFDRHLRMLADLGYRTVSLRDLTAARRGTLRLQDRAVVITLDDGFEDAVHHAPAALLAHGFTATFFIVAGLLGGTSEWTRWTRGCDMPLAGPRAVRELPRAGFGVGSHTMTHRPLGRIGPDACHQELSESKQRLEHLLGEEVCDLAYPFGSADARVRASAAACGYRTACSVTSGLSPETDDPLMLHRVEICGGESDDAFMWRLRTGEPPQQQGTALHSSRGDTALSRA